jgi:hypothetical protein
VAAHTGFRRRWCTPVLDLPVPGLDSAAPSFRLPDLALFYEDFLTVTDKDGNYIFVPSFSAENNPGNLNPSCMLVINASMDIAVCREVLANLVEACELLGIEADSVSKWKAMLAKLPHPQLDGTQKNGLACAAERRQRHVSSPGPGDEIDPTARRGWWPRSCQPAPRPGAVGGAWPLPPRAGRGTAQGCLYGR